MWKESKQVKWGVKVLLLVPPLHSLLSIPSFLLIFTHCSRKCAKTGDDVSTLSAFATANVNTSSYSCILPVKVKIYDQEKSKSMVQFTERSVRASLCKHDIWESRADDPWDLFWLMSLLLQLHRQRRQLMGKRIYCCFILLALSCGEVLADLLLISSSSISVCCCEIISNKMWLLLRISQYLRGLSNDERPRVINKCQLCEKEMMK